MSLPQIARVERLLRQRGEEGVTADLLLLPDVIDGGTPITRLASRIDELRTRGLTIVTERQPQGFARYVLREPRHASVTPASRRDDHGDHGGPTHLEVGEPPAPQSAVLGWDEQ